MSQKYTAKGKVRASIQNKVRLDLVNENSSWIKDKIKLWRQRVSYRI